MLVKTDIVTELLTIERDQENLVNEALNLISSDKNQYHQLISENKEHVLSEESIRKICLKYRLRFLEMKYFKNEIPASAFQRVAAYENKYKMNFKSLKLVAPSELFELEERDKDPILLGELGDGKYLYIEKWGGEFNPVRRLLSWPMRSVATMLFTVSAAALLLTSLLVPLVGSMSVPVFMIAFFMIWMGFIGMAAYVVFAFRLSPSTMNWDSKFFD